MTETQAMDHGFQHTGLFGFNLEGMMQKAMLIKKQGNDSLLIIIPYLGKPMPGKVSKSGWALYWKESDENREARKKMFASKSTKQLLSRKRLLEVELEDLDEKLKKLKRR